jgi:hypothetical protein
VNDLQPQDKEERHCPLCNGLLEGTAEEGLFVCMRCRSLARFRGGDLLAMYIPDYELRLEELQRRHAELLASIEAESGKGAARDMRNLRSLHEERQRVLSEFSFLGYFRQFVERWQER